METEFEILQPLRADLSWCGSRSETSAGRRARRRSGAGVVEAGDRRPRRCSASRSWSACSPPAARSRDRERLPEHGEHGGRHPASDSASRQRVAFRRPAVRGAACATDAPPADRFRGSRRRRFKLGARRSITAQTRPGRSVSEQPARLPRGSGRPLEDHPGRSARGHDQRRRLHGDRSGRVRDRRARTAGRCCRPPRRAATAARSRCGSPPTTSTRRWSSSARSAPSIPPQMPGPRRHRRLRRPARPT